MMEGQEIEKAIPATAAPGMTPACWIATTLVTFAAVIGIVAIFNATIDPLHLLRDDGVYVTDRDFQRTMNAGLIRTSAPFDALVVGSSFVGNFDPAFVQKQFGLKTLVVSVFGASQKEISATLAYALKRRRPKLVLLEASIWNDCNDADHPVWKFPYDTYQDSPLSLLGYLASGSTLDLSIDKFRWERGSQTKYGFSKLITDVPMWYTYFKGYFNNPDHLIQTFNKNDPLTNAVTLNSAEIESRAAVVAGCFSRSILPFVTEYPSTNFIIFNPPVFQRLLYNRARNGSIQTWNRAQELIVDRISAIPNVGYFDFYAATEIEDDCRRFMDHAHFDPRASDELVAWMKEGRFQRTPATNAGISAAVLQASAAPVECPLSGTNAL